MNTNLRNIFSLLMTGVVALTGAQTVIDSTAKNDTAKTADAPLVDTMKKNADTLRIVTPVFQVKTQKDTVLLITDKDEIAKIVSTISGKVKKSRLQGYGGAGGFGPRIALFDMRPIVDLVQDRDGLSYPTLGSGYSAMIMNGGLGYGGLGNGIRIGGGGWGGTRKFTSRPYRRVPGAAQDSVAEVTVDMSYGGFLIEKAFVKDNWNILVGGMVGGGGLTASRSYRPAKGVSAFSLKDIFLEKENASADLGTVELHGGATYTFVPWMHIGGDASMLMYGSINGFETVGTFYGIIPSIGFRIIFGNLG